MFHRLRNILGTFIRTHPVAITSLICVAAPEWGASKLPAKFAAMNAIGVAFVAWVTKSFRLQPAAVAGEEVVQAIAAAYRAGHIPVMVPPKGEPAAPVAPISEVPSPPAVAPPVGESNNGPAPADSQPMSSPAPPPRKIYALTFTDTAGLLAYLRSTAKPKRSRRAKLELKKRKAK